MATNTVRNSTGRAREKLARLAEPAAKFQAVGPEAAMYGIFGPQYAAALSAPTPSAAEQSMREMALRHGADKEAERYENQLALAREAQLQGIDREGYYNITGKILDKEPDGLIGMRGVRADPTTGAYGVFNDPLLAAASNDLAINEQVADTRLANAGAVENLAKAGIRTPVPTVQGYMKHPLQPNVDNYGVWNDAQYTPDQATDQYGQDQGLTAEQQLQIAQLRSKAGEDGLEGSVEMDPVTGLPFFKVKGGVNDVVNWYAENGGGPKGIPVNPKAGANSGTAPAPQAAPAHKFYAQVSSPVGMRTDPITGKPKMHKGQDSKHKENTPYPAEQDGVVASVGNVRGFGPHTVVVDYADGSRVLYGHGNAANVKPGQRIKAEQVLGLVGSQGRSTGPHMHRQVLRGPTRQGVQRADGTSSSASRSSAFVARMKQHSNVVSAEADEQGRVVVTVKNGEQRVFDSNTGKRIG